LLNHCNHNKTLYCYWRRRRRCWQHSPRDSRRVRHFQPEWKRAVERVTMSFTVRVANPNTGTAFNTYNSCPSTLGERIARAHVDYDVTCRADKIQLAGKVLWPRRSAASGFYASEANCSVVSSGARTLFLISIMNCTVRTANACKYH